jgi:hypothetical protein
MTIKGVSSHKMCEINLPFTAVQEMCKQRIWGCYKFGNKFQYAANLILLNRLRDLVPMLGINNS